MAAVTKNSKTNKITFFLQKGMVYLAEILSGTLMGHCCSEAKKKKKKKKSVAELCLTQ